LEIAKGINYMQKCVLILWFHYIEQKKMISNKKDDFIYIEFKTG
jgi:hypothetical protein